MEYRQEFSWTAGLSFRYPVRRFGKAVHRAHRKVGRLPRVRKVDRKMQRLARRFAKPLLASLGFNGPSRKWISWEPQ